LFSFKIKYFQFQILGINASSILGDC